MSSPYQDYFKSEIRLIEAGLKEACDQFVSGATAPEQRLKESMSYSLLGEGKRFRPLLSLLVAKALSKEATQVLDFALSLEMIHTYSLIHDDLPAMDNDDLRRGRPTNHKVYGEALALLSGSALYGQAFLVIAASPHLLQAKKIEVIRLLAEATGGQGLVAGQVMDIDNKSLDQTQVYRVHQLKTGALIELAVLGAAHFCEATSSEFEILKTYSRHLGLAFQLADDLLDADDQAFSILSLQSIEKTKEDLVRETELSLKALEGFGPKAEGLRFISEFNQKRLY